MTKKGNYKLLAGGFEFLKHYTSKQGDTTYWDCSKKHQLGCRGRAHTKQVGTKQMVKFLGTHNHFLDNIASEK